MHEVESALVVLVPEAEALVKPFREQYDPAAAMGIPAHVTLLYPFLPPSDIGSAVLADLRRCFADFAPFGFALTKVRRFPGVLYLGPAPDEPFRALTLAIWNRYPDWPPYEGRHSEIVTHLSVAQIADEPQLDSVADEFHRASNGKLPVRTSVGEVALMDNSAGRWQVRTTFRLGAQ